MTSMQLRRRHAKRPWKSMAFVWLRHAPQGGGALWRWSGRQLGLGRGAGQGADGGAELAAIVGADQRGQRGGSEEGRVGEEGRSRGAPDPLKKKKQMRESGVAESKVVESIRSIRTAWNSSCAVHSACAHSLLLLS